jgi:DNA repair protein RAD50
MENQIRDFKTQLAAYGNTDEAYRNEFYKVTTLEMSVHDLDLYAKTMDQAIMKFHSAKMEEINRTIRDLWINTYRGTGNLGFKVMRVEVDCLLDIDSIAIKTDIDTTAAGNRNYNYRVVMHKGSTELDMVIIFFNEYKYLLGGIFKLYK